MSLRNIMAMMTMVAIASQTTTRQPSRSHVPSTPKGRKSDYLPLPETFGNSGVTHKGHKSEVIDFNFEKDGYDLSISIRISFGTISSRYKQIHSLETQLKAYINRTPINKLLEFNQFTIIGGLKKAPGGLSQFIPTSLGKGDYEGICNRTDCKTNISALYYNHSTQKHYCRVCAQMINKVNHVDAIRLFGHELCTLV